MRIDRPDLDDYQHLSWLLPSLALLVLWGALRYSHSPAGLGAGLLIGLGVGLALVAVLVVQMHMWKELVARAVVAEGNPRLPAGFTLAVVVYGLGLMGAEFLAYRLFRGAGEAYLDSLGPGMIAGAFLPWAILNWPMQEIRKRADDLYRKRSRHKFHDGGDDEGDGMGE